MSATSARTELSGSPHAGTGTAATPAPPAPPAAPGRRVRAAGSLAHAPVLPTPALSPSPAPTPAPSGRGAAVAVPPHDTVPGAVPVDHAPGLATRRADRRVAQKLARRAQQRWAIAGCAILAAAFGLTVGILDVLH